MFRETLLDSASADRKRKRWPMAAAFTLEMIAAALLIVLPLLSTGVITASVRPPILVPLGNPDIARATPHTSPDEGIHVAHPVIVSVTGADHFRHSAIPADDSTDPGPSINIIGVPDGVRNMPSFDGPHTAPPVQPPPPQKPLRISELSEAHLLSKVDPVYPRIAIITGTQGEVKLHAIIAKDGHVESLSVISGHPMLASAALDAVRQWRYRPYFLNGEPVEVETFITVNFKKTND